MRYCGSLISFSINFYVQNEKRLRFASSLYTLLLLRLRHSRTVSDSEIVQVFTYLNECKSCEYQEDSDIFVCAFDTPLKRFPVIIVEILHFLKSFVTSTVKIIFLATNMLSFSPITFILPLSFLSFTLAQTPGTTQFIDAGEAVKLSVQWGSQPVNSYSLYAGSAHDFQLSAGRKGLNNESYDPLDQSDTDYCTVVDKQGPGCVHLNIVLKGTSGLRSWKILVAALGTIRGGAFYDKLWNYNANFNILFDNQVVGTGFTENRTDTSIIDPKT